MHGWRIDRRSWAIEVENVIYTDNRPRTRIKSIHIPRYEFCLALTNKHIHHISAFLSTDSSALRISQDGSPGKWRRVETSPMGRPAESVRGRAREPAEKWKITFESQFSHLGLLDSLEVRTVANDLHASQHQSELEWTWNQTSHGTPRTTNASIPHPTAAILLPKAALAIARTRQNTLWPTTTAHTLNSQTQKSGI